MAAPVGKFSQLELTEKMNSNINAMNETMSKLNSSFEGAMLVAQMDYAKSLLGKTVEYYYDDYGQSLEQGQSRLLQRGRLFDP